MTEQVYVPPRTVGYWARANNLTAEDLADVDDETEGFETLDIRIRTNRDRDEFRKGWVEADEEMKAERLQTLAKDLLTSAETPIVKGRQS